MINFLKQLLTPIRCNIVEDYRLQLIDGYACSGSITDMADCTDEIWNAHSAASYLDFGIATTNYGPGTPLWLTVQLLTSIGAQTALGMVKYALQESSDASAWRSIIESRTFVTTAASPLVADGVGFKMLNVPIPQAHQRYLRIAWICTDAISDGTFDAYLHSGGAHDL